MATTKQDRTYPLNGLERLGVLINIVRKEYSVSQRKLADWMGVSDTTLCKIERGYGSSGPGRYIISDRVLSQIAAFLGTDLQQLQAVCEGHYENLFKAMDRGHITPQQLLERLRVNLDPIYLKKKSYKRGYIKLANFDGGEFVGAAEEIIPVRVHISSKERLRLNNLISACSALDESFEDRLKRMGATPVADNLMDVDYHIYEDHLNRLAQCLYAVRKWKGDRPDVDANRTYENWQQLKIILSQENGTSAQSH